MPPPPEWDPASHYYNSTYTGIWQYENQAKTHWEYAPPGGMYRFSEQSCPRCGLMDRYEHGVYHDHGDHRVLVLGAAIHTINKEAKL